MINNNIGKVYIVGAGPGDPDLLTLKAYNLIKRKADVVVYDRLVPDEILRLIPSNVIKIYAGKSCKNHEMTQEQINNALVEQSKMGRTVVRLKGGDPVIFGRVGEEIDFLYNNQIDFEIIPGITSASGCAAAANIPLTHRGVSSGVRFITGHQKKGEKINVNWQELANPQITLVVYMGLSNINEITNNLILAGADKNTPIAAIQSGTTKEQKLLISTLEKITNLVIEKKFQAPTLLIIGNVINYAKL